MEEQLQKVESVIQKAKEMQKGYQSLMNANEEELRELVEERDEGVWRVWSRSHC